MYTRSPYALRKLPQPKPMLALDPSAAMQRIVQLLQEAQDLKIQYTKDFSLAIEAKMAEVDAEIERVQGIQIQGAQGIQGPQGARGEQGLQGFQGVQGEMGPMGPKGKDGKNGKDGKDGVKGKDGKDGVNPEPEDFIKIIKEKGLLKVEHIDGLRAEVDNYRSQLAGKHYGSTTMLRGGGDSVAAGTNVTISNVNGVKTISSTGSGLSVLAATGTIDDSNTVFTFASAPTLVVVNGAMYRHGSGVSIVATTATLDNPVGTGGDVYALGA